MVCEQKILKKKKIKITTATKTYANRLPNTLSENLMGFEEMDQEIECANGFCTLKQMLSVRLHV